MNILLQCDYFYRLVDLSVSVRVCVVIFLKLCFVESTLGAVYAQDVNQGLSTQDQYIIIGCVSGFTLGLLVAFIIVCLLRCNGNKNKIKEDSNDTYKPIERFTSSEYTHSIGSGDRKLATSAQMYHYQLHKQQLIDMENKADAERLSTSEKQDNDTDSVDECTVFECPGLAKMQNMEIHNPLFDNSEKDVVREGST